MGVDLDAWIDKLKRCEYLAEDELKALCEYVRLFVQLVCTWMLLMSRKTPLFAPCALPSALHSLSFMCVLCNACVASRPRHARGLRVPQRSPA